jgi:hypothetical protein
MYARVFRPSRKMPGETVDNQRNKDRVVSGGESSVPRVPANVAVLRRALLVCVVLVLAPTVVAVWAATTPDEDDHPPRWVTDQQALMDAVDHDNALIDQDLLKPQARGEFGPFVLVGPGDSNESATRERCDTRAAYGLDAQLPLLPLKEILSSPLTIPELSSNVAIAAGCDGVVTMVNGGWLMPNEWGGDEAVDVVVYLVGYLPFRLEWQQATDRTEFGKIDGYPALIEHPIPDLISRGKLTSSSLSPKMAAQESSSELERRPLRKPQKPPSHPWRSA